MPEFFEFKDTSQLYFEEVLISSPLRKSLGLQEPETEYAQPRVSPYRLAAHLTSAFVIYSGLFWTALSVMSPYPSPLGDAGRASMVVRRFAVPVAALVGLTAVSGAFVAGNDAVSHFSLSGQRAF